MLAIAAVDDVSEILLDNELIDFELEHIIKRIPLDIAEILRNYMVEDDTSDRVLDDLSVSLALILALDTNLDECMEAERSGLVCHKGFLFAGECLMFAVQHAYKP